MELERSRLERLFSIFNAAHASCEITSPHPLVSLPADVSTARKTGRSQSLNLFCGVGRERLCPASPLREKVAEDTATGNLAG
jgi:hypothetical protein